MKTLMPETVEKVKVAVEWPKLFKSERVAVCMIDLSESGHLDVPLDKLSEFLRAKGYPQIAWAVDQRINAGSVPALLNIGKDDEASKRKFVKQIIKGVNGHGI